MKKYINPTVDTWKKLTARPLQNNASLFPLVSEVFNEVHKNGDKALREYTFRFDKARLRKLTVSKDDLKNASELLSESLKKSILIAADNIRRFHKKQVEKKKIVETFPGVFCWRESRPVERVGIYIPGGSAPLFSTVLMLGIPAQLAGCKEIVVCTPPDKDGKINPAILFASTLIGANAVYKLGGIQAIAAIAQGTESIPAVDKIFGPGNQYVTAAKQYAQMTGVAIDMPAGPSEVLVIADETSNPDYVAADLLSQAEHGADSQVVLLCTNETIFNSIKRRIGIQLKELPREDVACLALVNSLGIIFNDVDTCIRFSNLYAPEHLILSFEKSKSYIDKIQHAGSVFLGKYSCESAGDYASGTNHTLPTNGYARAYSGVSLDSFIKKITFQSITKKGIKKLGPVIEEMAEAEQLMAHKNAVTIRLNTLKNENNG